MKNTLMSRPGALVLFTALLAGCGTTITGFDDAVFQVIEETAFDPSLEIDLNEYTRLETGVYIKDLVVGEGTAVVYGISPEVTYTGWLANGQQFDRGVFTFLMGNNEVIPGFEHGLLGMRVGGTRRMIIPPALGYGALGSGPVPAGAIVIFEVELTDAA